jgi:hypothetical protein
MIKLSLLFLFSFIFFYLGLAQYKIVKLESENLYINYYYKSDSSDRLKNDSTLFLCLRSKEDTVRIEKFVNSAKIWSRLYIIKLAKNKLRIRQRNGVNTNIVYKPFYIAKLAD